LLTTNFKQNAIDLSYISVTPSAGTNIGINGWLRSKYYIYQYPNLIVNSSPSSYLINQQLQQNLTLHDSVVGFKFLVIGGGGAGQNAGGNQGASIYGVGGSGGGCVVGYYNFVSGDSKTLNITVGVGGVAGSSGQYDAGTYPYFGNTASSQGSQPGQNGYPSSITSNSISIIAGGGPGGTSGNNISPPYQSGSTSSANITYFFNYDSASPNSSQVGTDSGFTQIYNYPPFSNLLQLIQPNVYQVNNSNQIIFSSGIGSSNQYDLSYMYGNGYNIVSGMAYSRNYPTNVGSGGYGGCRSNYTSVIGYYGNNNTGNSSGAGPGSAGAPGLVLIVPQFTTITSV
jgi:hypothetical protein